MGFPATAATRQADGSPTPAEGWGSPTLPRPELVHNRDGTGHLLTAGIALVALPLVDAVMSVIPHHR